MRIHTVRILAVAAVIAGPVVPSMAHATGSHRAGVSCHLLTDPAGDTQSVGPDNDQDLDLRGGDIVTSRTRLTAVIRLQGLSKDDVTEPAGRIYEFDFTANDKNFILMGALLTGGSEFEAYISKTRFEKGKSGARAATGIGQITGTLDLRHKAVWFNAPLSIFRKYASFSQTYLDHLVLFTYRAHGESMRALPTGKVADISVSAGVGVDQDWSSRLYIPTHASCIHVGETS